MAIKSLLPLHRELTEEQKTIVRQDKQISKLQSKLGELESENKGLIHQLEKTKDQVKPRNKQEEYIGNLKRQLNETTVKMKTFKKLYEEYLQKYLRLANPQAQLL